MPAKAPAYDEVRRLAWDILAELERSSAFADALLERTYSQNPQLSALDRAFIQELVFGTLRWRGRIDAILAAAAKFPQKKIETRLQNLLRLGAYQILFMDRVPDSAAVDESVRLAKAVFQNQKISGFANAILRSLARKPPSENFSDSAATPAEYTAQALSHPLWLVERWIKEFGPETTRRICEADNTKPPFTIRVNTMKGSREELQQELRASGIESSPTPFSPDGLVLKKGISLAEEKLFQGGWYFVQDEASQIIPLLMDLHPGETVLDACAAPGGKSTHMAQIMKDQGEILSLDIRKSRVDLIRENSLRLALSIIKGMEADASRPLPFPEKLQFDKILLDAPCTGLGILHRNPETKWRRKPEDIFRMQRLQASLIENVSSRLKDGGILVYSTCTMAREENDDIIRSFLRVHRDFRLEDLRTVVDRVLHPLMDKGGFFRTYPDWIVNKEDYRLDGFFAARLRRRRS